MKGKEEKEVEKKRTSKLGRKNEILDSVWSIEAVCQNSSISSGELYVRIRK